MCRFVRALRKQHKYNSSYLEAAYRRRHHHHRHRLGNLAVAEVSVVALAAAVLQQHITSNTPFTRSSRHQANIKQPSSKCIQNTRARRVH